MVIKKLSAIGVMSIGVVGICPESLSELPPVRLQVGYLVDTASYSDGNIELYYESGIAEGMYHISETLGGQKEALVYFYSNRPGLGWNPPDPMNGRSATKISDFVAIENSQIFQGLEPRPISDADWRKAYSSLQDVMYHTLTFDNWIKEDFDENGLPVVRFLSVGTDVVPWSDWTGPSSFYGGLPRIQDSVAGTFSDPESYFKWYDYPRLEHTSNAARLMPKNTFIQIMTTQDEQFQVPNVLEWYKDVYIPKGLGGIPGWADEVTSSMDYVAIQKLFVDRVREAVCVTLGLLDGSTIFPPPSPPIPTTPAPPSPPSEYAPSPSCPKTVATESLPKVHLQIAILFDISAFEDLTLRDMYYMGLYEVLYNSLEFPRRPDFVTYGYNNRPGVGWNPPTPMDGRCGEKITEMSNQTDPTLVLDQFLHWQPRPITDVSWDKTYSSLQDVMYHTLSYDNWIREDFDSDGLPVVRHIIVATDSVPWSDWTQPCSYYGGLVLINDAVARTYATPSSYCTWYRYPTMADTAMAARAMPKNTYFHIMTAKREQRDVPNVVDWFRDVYFPLGLGKPNGWVDELTNEMDYLGMTNIIKKRMLDAVCVACGQAEDPTTTPGPPGTIPPISGTCEANLQGLSNLIAQS